ncbi:DEAD-box ATP-dependent RNA helicase 31 [Linum perenne]
MRQFREGAPPRRTSGRGGSSENGRGRGRGGVDSGFRKDVVKKSSIGKRSLLGSDEDSVDEDDDDEEAPIRGFDHLLGEDDSDDVDDTEDDEDDDEDDSVYKNHASSSLGLEKKYEAKVIPSSTGSSTASSTASSASYLSETRFDQCSVSPLTLKAIKDAGYENMTVVQAATLPVILKGKDVLAKARTGTGKTVAFLLPSIEVIVKTPPADHDNKRPPILVLVICPTRELALQAAAEANKLLKYHPSLGVQCVIGGTRLALEQKKLQANPCQILVATPGRLRDHLENTAGFATKVKGVKVLVLDEADRLLDMGFRKDIDKIIAAVSKERQTLLFSATVPPEVRQMCHVALKRDHEYINTVEEGSEETHAKVSQMHMVAPLQKHFPLLYALLRDHIADNVDYKVLVFCTTAMVTRLVADCLGELKLNIREIHSRKSQSYRSKVSDEFRNSKGLILVTSDVSARGVDYPDVTLVVQVGIPSDREQYIHRLGRTGRKGKEGQGVLLLAPWEEFFLSTVKDLPISKADVPTIDPDTTKKVERALSNVEMKSKESAYQAWLGYYNSDKKIGKDKFKLVELANEFSRSMGLDNPPAIPKITLGKMGLKNIPGLRSK